MGDERIGFVGLWVCYFESGLGLKPITPAGQTTRLSKKGRRSANCGRETNFREISASRLPN